MNNPILNANDILNMNPYEYLLSQYYTNVVNRNIVRQLFENVENNNMENLFDNVNINVVLNTMNIIIDNLSIILNQNDIRGQLNDEQLQRLQICNILRG